MASHIPGSVNRPRADAITARGTRGADRPDASSHPLGSHTAKTGDRGPSLLQRIKNFFKSVKSFFSNLAGAKKGDTGASRQASLGQAPEGRRKNAETAPGPRLEGSDGPPRTRERSRSEPPPRLRTDAPGLEERPRARSVDSPPGGNGVDDPGEPPDDDGTLDPPDDGSRTSTTRQRPRGMAMSGDAPPRLDGSDGGPPRSVGSGVRGIEPRDLPRETVKAHATVALRDLGRAGLSGDNPAKLDGGKLIAFMGGHVVATGSQGFWDTPQAKANVAVLGGALAMSLLDKVKNAGEMTAQDRTDFMRALELLPRDPDGPPLLAIPDDMLGKLDEAGFDKLLSAMTDLLLSVYGGADSTHPLPGDTDPATMLKDATEGTEASPAQKIDILRDILVEAIEKHGPPPDVVKQALEAMR
ncbi:MAG TPA: hypothetical protein PKA13_11920 [Geminicoccaceae bacterium]|nr:hypothetical protein [Geminicoccus sp.]HMU50473.1 hypothetical protein [Geminicoccaceae bacterium]